MSHPPSQPFRPSIAFATLVEDVTKHPWLPVIIKKVFEVSGSTAFQRYDGLHHLSQVEHDAKALQIFAEAHGSLAAEKQWSRTDVFMSAVVTALDRVNVVGTQGCGELTNTIAICRSTLGNSWTDHRFVGATDSHRTGRTHEKHPIPQAEGIQQPDAIRQGVDDVSRCDRTQRLKGIQKSSHTTRKPLSDKAKKILERWFQDHLDNPYPTSKQKQELTKQCAVSLPTVNNWFGNKRMRIKRKMLQVDSQVGEHIAEKVLAPRSKWNAVVMSKMTSHVGREVVAHATGLALLCGKDGTFDKEGHSRQAQERDGPSGPGRREKEHRANSRPTR